MKNFLKIGLLCVMVALMSGCDAQKRAQRQVRRAVEKCPELVQVKAHPIDTFLSVPTFADVTTVPMWAVMSYDTIYAATPHGTVVVSLSQSDSSLRVGFVAAPQKVHYQDTIRYSQVVLPPREPQPAKGSFWRSLAICLLGIGIGAALCFYLLQKLKTTKP